jgi:hypothetical protein
LPDSIEHAAVDPFHDGDGAISAFRVPGFSAADALHFSLDFFEWSDWQRRSPRRVDQILPFGINGNAALGHNHIDQFTGSAQGGHFVDDDGNAVAKRG